MATKLNNYADVQALLDSFVKSAGVTPGLAPHHIFWHALNYTQFTTGNVPNIGVPILVKGHADQSNLIQVLSGTSQNFDQMPQPNPPYNAASPSQNDVIAALTDWINSNCPNSDDLTLVEGIGPKIHATLNDNGIHSFEDLAAAKVVHLQNILKTAGHAAHNPGSWPAQAALAHNGQTETLAAFQDLLKGGKVAG